MTQNLDGNAGANYDKILSEYFISDHLQPGVALAIATKRRLQTRHNLRLVSLMTKSEPLWTQWWMGAGVV